MPYLTDDPEGYYDDESIAVLGGPSRGWGSFSLGEDVGPRYVRDHRTNASPYRPYWTPPIAPPAPPRPVTGLTGATLNTPAGNAQMRFERPVATKESVDSFITELKRDVAAVFASVRNVDQTVDKNTSILDKKVAALEAMMKRSQKSAQMGLILPLLLNKPQALDTIKVKENNEGAERSFTVTDTKFKSADSTGLLVAVLAMSGGLGGGGNGSGDDSMSTLLLVLALSGGLGGSK